MKRKSWTNDTRFRIRHQNLEELRMKKMAEHPDNQAYWSAAEVGKRIGIGENNHGGYRKLETGATKTMTLAVAKKICAEFSCYLKTILYLDNPESDQDDHTAMSGAGECVKTRADGRPDRRFKGNQALRGKVTVLMPEKQQYILEYLADKEGTSVNQIIIRAIDAYIYGR